MRNLADLLADTVEQEAVQIENVLVGLDQLDAHEGYQTRQCFSFLMPFPIYVQLRELNNKLRGKNAKKLDPDSKKHQSFTVKVPTHPFEKFRKLAFDFRDKQPEAEQDLYTLTAWANEATVKFLIPAHHELIARASEYPDFQAAVVSNKTKYNLSAFVSAAIKNTITPVLVEAIKQARAVPLVEAIQQGEAAASASDQQAA